MSRTSACPTNILREFAHTCGHSTTDHPSLQEQQLSYALAKQVPDMLCRGFTIETSYGEIVIEPGRHADAIATTVRRVLEVQLKAAELARRDADMDRRCA